MGRGTVNATTGGHDPAHPQAWTPNQHGAFVDEATHQRVVKHGDHFDRVLTPNQSSHVFTALLLIIILTQIGLHTWKKYRFRSFQIVTLVGLWVLPICMACYVLSWKFALAWLAFSCKSAQMFHLARQGDKMAKDVPRQPCSSGPGLTAGRRVYGFFFRVYRGTFALSSFGYGCILMNIFGISLLLRIHHIVASIGLQAVFYGLYFGVMGRDCAELCSEYMARGVGVTKAQQKYYDASRCAICSLEFRDPESEDMSSEPAYALACGHLFHEHCIRGWALVGKRDTCPLCDEKVDMKGFSKTPWGLDGKGALWGQLLDAVRYLVVWNPVILLLINGGMHLFGLH